MQIFSFLFELNSLVTRLRRHPAKQFPDCFSGSPPLPWRAPTQSPHRRSKVVTSGDTPYPSTQRLPCDFAGHSPPAPGRPTSFKPHSSPTYRSSLHCHLPSPCDDVRRDATSTRCCLTWWATKCCSPLSAANDGTSLD